MTIIVDGYFEPLGRCEACGTYAREYELYSTLRNQVLCRECYTAPRKPGKLEVARGRW